MGRNKKKDKRSHSPEAPWGGLDVSSGLDASGPQRVLLLRHGQSEANATGDDVPDAPLSKLGRVQAAAWHGHIEQHGAEVVLISPLRRAVETACLAFEGMDVPLELCRFAREGWWHERQNQLGSPGQLQDVLKALPRGDEVQEIHEAFTVGPDDPMNETESFSRLRAVLAQRPERSVAIVCHWGVINDLCDASAGNAELIECERLAKSGYIKARKHHKPPNAPRTA